jgi:predicted glycosyltransferase
MRFLFYSHDAVGLGHMRRNLALAARLADSAPGASVLLAVGTDEVNRVGVPPNVEVIKLPGLRKVANERYGSRYLSIPGPDVLALRAAVLETLVSSYRPDVMVVDKHPLGASGELVPALEALRDLGRCAVLGVRDILDDPDAVQREWTPEIHAGIARYYDRVFVYGQRRVFDPVREYGWPSAVAERIHFCGYVVSRFDSQDWREEGPPAFLTTRRTRPLVLATAGSGEDGFTLLRGFVDAAAGAPWDAAVVTGPMASRDDHEELRRTAAEAGIACHSSVPGLGRWFGAVDALVSMCGYNTITEAVSTGLPTVCVPRTVPRVEQLIRARAFERLGLLRVVEPQHLTPAVLRAEIGRALAVPRRALLERARRAIDFDGAGRAAEHLLDLAAVRAGV